MRYAITLLLCLFSLLSQAQIIQDNFNQKFIRYLTGTLPEKVYLQTDKPYYVVEDTIWLKAYVVNAQIHQPSPSNFVYIELINQLDSVERRIKIRKNGYGFCGYLPLSKELIPGEYALRGYTHWMRNEPSDYFFRKNITIERIIQTPKVLTLTYHPAKEGELRAVAHYTYSDGSPVKNCRIDFSYNKDGEKYRKRYNLTNSKGEINLQVLQGGSPEKQQLSATVFDTKGGIVHKQEFAIPSKEGDYDVQFFPESGILLADVPQTIAFKAIGANGLSTIITGKVLSAGGESMADIATQHNGMGRFPLLPQKDSTYFAVVTNKEGVEKKFQLPKVHEKGIVLQLHRKGGACTYMFENTTGLPTDSLYLIAHSRGMLSMAKPLNANSKIGKFSLNHAPEGILNVAIVNKTGDVFCERMIYVKRGIRHIPQVQTDRTEYGIREKVELKLTIPDKGDFALSVTDGQLVKWDSLENNIITQLLMKSELRGHIENPGYYFTADNPQVNEHLDLLMLTQGWKKYDLPSILKGCVLQPKYPLEIGQSLTGKVKPILRKKMDGVEVTGFSNQWKAVHAQVDSMGYYAFNGIEFPDSTAFTINAVNKKGKAKGIVIYPDAEIFPDSRIFIPNPGGVVQEKRKNTLEEYQQTYMQNNIWKEITLDEISVTAKYISKTGKLAGEFASYADYVITDKKIENEYKDRSVWDIVKENIIDKMPGITQLTEDEYTYRGSKLQFSVDMRLIEPKDLRYYMASEIASISFFRDAKSVPVYVPNLVVGVIVPEGGLLVDSELEPGSIIKSVDNPDFKYLSGWDKEDLLRYTAEMSKYKGVILIELKNGGSAHYYRPSIGLATLYPLGYQKPAEFYSPKYEVPDSLQNSRTDFRTTVYWNPCIQTDSTGYAKVSFYTTDMKHDMEYVLEGITEEGMPCRTTGKIIIKKD